MRDMISRFVCRSCFLCFPLFASGADAGERLLSADRLREAVEGYWIGQLAGNYIGFPFENLYQEEPIPVLVERYYTWQDAEREGLKMNVNDRRAFLPILADALGGAWSDDDSDIEFVYLHAVEEHGLDLSYAEAAEAWKRSINRFVWSANGEARRLMGEGLVPPATGSKENNRFWYRISSQLTTEIWGVFYPGMTEKGAERAQWAGAISTDDWATHPDRFFGAMFSAAYFEKDVAKLIGIGRNTLPDDSPFARGIDDCVGWHGELADWREARQRLHEKYYHQVGSFRVPEPFAGAVVNGLAAVLALLYGEGDWTRTVAIATSLGYDCDNQAATVGALLGMAHGAGVIPERFTLEMPSRGRWSKPFNDTYINYSRDGLPAYNRIGDIVDRIAAIAETAILQNGGRRVEGEGVVYRVVCDF